MAARRRPPTEKNGSVVHQPEIGGDLAAAGLVGRCLRPTAQKNAGVLFLSSTRIEPPPLSASRATAPEPRALRSSPAPPSTARRSRPRAPAAAPGRPPPRGSACRGAGQQGQGSSPPPAGLSRFPLPPARAAPAGRRRGRGTPAGLLAPEGRGPDPAIPVLRQSRGVPVLTAQRTAQICSFHLD